MLLFNNDYCIALNEIRCFYSFVDSNSKMNMNWETIKIYVPLDNDKMPANGILSEYRVKNYIYVLHEIMIIKNSGSGTTETNHYIYYGQMPISTENYNKYTRKQAIPGTAVTTTMSETQTQDAGFYYSIARGKEGEKTLAKMVDGQNNIRISLYKTNNTLTGEYQSIREKIISITGQQAYYLLYETNLFNVAIYQKYSGNMTASHNIASPNNPTQYKATTISGNTETEIAKNDVIIKTGGSNSNIYSATDYFNHGQDMYQAGQNAGYTQGYNEGLADGQSGEGNSFLNLFSAIIQAPVNVFTKILDFEIFGFNIAGIAIGLIAVAMIIAFMRWSSGKTK